MGLQRWSIVLTEEKMCDGLKTPVQQDLSCNESLGSNDIATSPFAIISPKIQDFFPGVGSGSETTQYRCEWHTWLVDLLDSKKITVHEMFRTAALADSFINLHPGVAAGANAESARYLFPSCLGIAMKFEGNKKIFLFHNVLRLVCNYTEHGMLLETKLRLVELLVLKSLDFKVARSTVLSSFLDCIAEQGLDVDAMVASTNTVSAVRFLHVTKNIMFSAEAMDDDLRRTATKHAASEYVAFLGIT